VKHIGVRSAGRRATPLLLLLGLVAACGGDGGPDGDSVPVPSSLTTAPTQPEPTGTVPTGSGPSGTPKVQVLATGLDVPWGLAFLPDGSALVAERPTGRIVKVSPTGARTEVQRLTGARATGEGGLLGLAVSPKYASDGLVYAYYTGDEDNRIVRFRLGGQPEPILTGLHKAPIHDGGRIAFGPDGMLYAGVGDANERPRAQDPAALNGKVLRMTPDGKPAPGNPFPNSVVYSYGHRNVQGLAWDSAGRLYAAEFGQNRFDEVNLIQAGKNYGWPVVEGNADDSRFVRPIVTWPTTDASPSGIAIKGDQLFLAALRGERLWRVPLNGRGGVAGDPVSLLQDEYGRLRSVAFAPDGSLWVTTSNRDGRGDTPAADDDRILRLTWS
jgi:glucose/arabinose dehydrogenase